MVIDDNGNGSPAFLTKRTKCKKHTVTNADAMPAEINTPITVRMTDHNLQDAINQCNKGYYTNGSHETFF